MMTIRKTIIAAAALALAGMTAPAQADTPPAPAASTAQSYAFVDMIRVMHETTAGKAVGDELQAKKKALNAELDKKAMSVRNDEQSFDKERDTMGKEQLAAKKQAIGQKIDDIRKYAQEHTTQFDYVANQAMAKVRDLAGDAVEEVAQKHKYTAVFTREAVIIGAKDLDITDEVIADMNASGKKVAVDWSAKPSKEKDAQ